MSAAAPPTRAKPGPRWSVVRPAGLLPRSITGLLASGAIVCVGPPLLTSGPSSGSVPAGRLLPPVIVAPVGLRMRLKLTVAVPRRSGAMLLVLLAMIVLVTERVPGVPTRATPPPPKPVWVLLTVLLTIVQFWI